MVVRACGATMRQLPTAAAAATQAAATGSGSAILQAVGFLRGPQISAGQALEPGDLIFYGGRARRRSIMSGSTSGTGG